MDVSRNTDDGAAVRLTWFQRARSDDGCDLNARKPLERFNRG